MRINKAKANLLFALIFSGLLVLLGANLYALGCTLFYTFIYGFAIIYPFAPLSNLGVCFIFVGLASFWLGRESLRFSELAWNWGFKQYFTKTRGWLNGFYG